MKWEKNKKQRQSKWKCQWGYVVKVAAVKQNKPWRLKYIIHTNYNKMSERLERGCLHHCCVCNMTHNEVELSEGGKEERLNKIKDKNIHWQLSLYIFSNQIIDLVTRQFDIYEKLQWNQRKA